MPREIALSGALVPGLFLLVLLSLLAVGVLDWLAGRYGFYRHFWHPPLLRLAVFTCIFCGLGLLATR